MRETYARGAQRATSGARLEERPTPLRRQLVQPRLLVHPSYTRRGFTRFLRGNRGHDGLLIPLTVVRIHPSEALGCRGVGGFARRIRFPRCRVRCRGSNLGDGCDHRSDRRERLVEVLRAPVGVQHRWRPVAGALPRPGVASAVSERRADEEGAELVNANRSRCRIFAICLGEELGAGLARDPFALQVLTERLGGAEHADRLPLLLTKTRSSSPLIGVMVRHARKPGRHATGGEGSSSPCRPRLRCSASRPRPGTTTPRRPARVTNAGYLVARDGTITEVARDPAFINGSRCGRQPAGLVWSDPGGGDAVTRHLVRAAYLEAASVVAFRRLELELRRFGAPPSLVARTRRSRAEEIDHARETAQLARARGGVVPALDVTPMSVRSLVDIALENAVEGCVRETYGALVASFQAERCAPELRPLLRRIAVDEASHAQLAHDVARWLDRQLARTDRARVTAARAGALADLRAAAIVDPEPQVAEQLGVPTREAAIMLIDGLERVFLAAA